MTAPQLAHAEPLAAAMTAIYAAGFPLLPLGGDDGKKPLLSGWHERRRLPLAVVHKIMARHGSLTYGIRLDGLLVIDLDTDNEATQAYFAERFDPSPVIVATGRGFHHYFRHSGTAPAKVRAPGIAIDFKGGKAAFTVGPGSIRPDGREYRAIAGSLASTPLPLFVDRGPPAAGADLSTALDISAAEPRVPVGSRHDALLKRAIEYAPCVDTFDELLADLKALKEFAFAEAATVSDDEIVRIAQWAWRKRLEGQLFSGRNSAVKVNRLALDALHARRDGLEALALYMLLLSAHGHHPGKVFAIVPDAIIAAGRLTISRAQLYRARDVLVEECLLGCVFQGRGRIASQYRLISPLVASALREGRKNKGEKALNYIGVGSETQEPTQGAAA